MSKWQGYNNAKTAAKIIISTHESKTHYCEETKVIEHATDYIDTETDKALINQFQAIVNTSKDVAITFLQTNDWNVLFAVNKYYATNGEASNHKVLQTKTEHLKDVINIYNHGIAFWYW
eukprot:542518_1